MEIHALSLRVTAEELTGWLGRLMSEQSRVRGLSVAITEAGGPRIRGEGSLMGMWIPFEATLEAGADGGFIALRLAGIQAAGFVPVPPSLILAELQRHQRPWLRLEQDSLVLNVELLLQSLGISLTANLSGVRCEPGALVLEARAPEDRMPAAP